MTSLRGPRPLTALLILLGVGLCWLVGATSAARAATDSPRSSGSASVQQTLGPADPSTSSPSRMLRTTSTGTPTPTQQTPTNATNNEPGLVVGGAVVLVALIGGGAVAARRRLTDDDHE